jgi:hypothetical protein
MTTIEVFDPAMCCSTGVWGPPYETCEMGCRGSEASPRRRTVGVRSVTLDRYIDREPNAEEIEGARGVHDRRLPGGPEAQGGRPVADTGLDLGACWVSAGSQQDQFRALGVAPAGEGVGHDNR